MPKFFASSCSRFITPCITLSRSLESIVPTVRLVTSSLSAACTIGLSRTSALRRSTPVLRMNWRASVTRHLISQSITRLCFSAVKIGRVSGLSRVWVRRSMNLTFCSGGGSLNFSPGSVITSLISPSA